MPTLLWEAALGPSGGAQESKTFVHEWTKDGWSGAVSAKMKRKLSVKLSVYQVSCVAKPTHGDELRVVIVKYSVMDTNRDNLGMWRGWILARGDPGLETLCLSAWEREYHNWEFQRILLHQQPPSGSVAEDGRMDIYCQKWLKYEFEEPCLGSPWLPECTGDRKRKRKGLCWNRSLYAVFWM